MIAIEVLTRILGLSFVSGINLYVTVLVVGLGIRYDWVQGLPAELEVLAHPAVLIVAGILYTVEFLADKVPVVASMWDAIHTFIRPAGGALLALAAVNQVHVQAPPGSDCVDGRRRYRSGRPLDKNELPPHSTCGAASSPARRDKLAGRSERHRAAGSDVCPSAPRLGRVLSPYRGNNVRRSHFAQNYLVGDPGSDRPTVFLGPSLGKASSVARRFSEWPY